MSTTETIQFQATPEFRHELETQAAKLNQSLAAYILYLHTRMLPTTIPIVLIATFAKYLENMAI